MQLRVARHTDRLAAVVAFYRDGLGFIESGGFDDHDGYDGRFLAVPGSDAHLELTSGGGHAAPEPHPESLLVLYLGDEEAVGTVAARLGDPVRPANPYWDEHGLTFEDPDGFRVVLVPERWEGSASELHRRRTQLDVTGPELDMAHQAAADALVSITARLGQFRGESRFTTWACKFAIFEA